MFYPVAHYGYLLPNMYLFIADIANTDLDCLSYRTWIRLDITHFCEEQRQRSALPACQKNSMSGPHCWGREGSTQFAHQFMTVPASFSVHLASSAVTPAGSVHKSRGDNVVRM